MRKDIAMQHGFPWPLTKSELKRALGDELLGVPPRAREVVYLSHRLWPMQEGVEVDA